MSEPTHTGQPRSSTRLGEVRACGQSKEGFELSPSDAREAKEKLPSSVQVLHETIRVRGELEMSCSVAALAWSSLAAGLSMGLCLLCSR
jgi:formate-nitrite transporter family protein